MFSSNLVEKFSATYCTSFPLHAVCCTLVNNENLPRNDWLLKDSMLRISCQKRCNLHSFSEFT